jgi:hypothetical protein
MIKICENPKCKKKYQPNPHHSKRQKYCSMKCVNEVRSNRIKNKHIKNSGRYKHQIGEKSSRWKGGETLNKDGYILEYCPNHPFAIGNPKKYVLQHRLVMEAHIGRVLLPIEIVHHINGIKTDNRIENLMLFSCKGEHSKITYSLGQVRNKNGRFVKL